MSTTVRAGLAASAVNNSAVTTATFENVSLTSGSSKLTNGGFESGSSPWSFSGSASRVAGNARSGAYAGAITGSNSGFLYTLSGLAANTTYVFRAFAKAAAGDSVFLGAKSYGGPDRSVAIMGTTYAQAYVTFTTGAANTSVQLFLWKDAGLGTSYGDDFELVLA
jgi:cystathionine beta-lyase/cystathionine gamma-synthase